MESKGEAPASRTEGLARHCEKLLQGKIVSERLGRLDFQWCMWKKSA